MSISSIKTNDQGYDYSLGGQTADTASVDSTASGAARAANVEQAIYSPAVKDDVTVEHKRGSKDIEYVSAEMNKFMELMEAGIRFKLHQKTGRLMVEVVDIQKNKVLKELPPHEMLDTIAKIRDYVGFILDKKA